MMNDLISRQAVLDIVDDLRDQMTVEGYCAMVERVKALATNLQQTCNLASNDCISRQATIDEIEERKNANGYRNVAVISELNRLEGYIMRLPSAQPEQTNSWCINSWCNDCKDDVISRAEAIRVASGYCHPANIAKELAKLPSAQPERKTGRWIPCSERLPEAEVLCCDKRGEMIIGYPYQDDESNTGYSAVLDDVVMIDCTAWMPLPEPYQEGEG